MDQASSVVCICETNEGAQRARYNLEASRIDLGTLSIATLDIPSDVHDLSYYSVGDATFTIPGIGFLLVNGPLASWIVTAFDNRTGGETSVLGAALATLHIPHDKILQYEAAVRADKYLLVVHGSPEAVAAALSAIGGTTHCSHTVHGEKVFDSVHGPGLLAIPAYAYPS